MAGVWTVIVIQSKSPHLQIPAKMGLEELLREAHKMSRNIAPNIQGVMTGDVIDISSDQVIRLWQRLGLV